MNEKEDLLLIYLLVYMLTLLKILDILYAIIKYN
jgi:hypothetical protein